MKLYFFNILSKNGCATQRSFLNSHGPIFISRSPSAWRTDRRFARDQIFSIFTEKKETRALFSRRSTSAAAWSTRGSDSLSSPPLKILFKSLQGAAGIYRDASRVLLTKLKLFRAVDTAKRVYFTSGNLRNLRKRSRNFSAIRALWFSTSCLSRDM